MSTPILLGLIAGGTIFLGLPVAVLPRVGVKTRGFLTAFSTGVLIFLLVEIMASTMEWIEDLFSSASEGFPTTHEALLFSGVLLLGLSIGLLGMAFFEKKYVRTETDPTQTGPSRAAQLSAMIAIGIGVHNFTEGLAIAQSYGFGHESLAWLLALGFALHNATEGFGIAGPLAGERPSWKFLIVVGLVGGAPVLFGAWLGSLWQNDVLRIFSMALAAGTILYLVGELLHLGRTLKGRGIVEVGLLLGFAVGFATEMFLVSVG